MNILCTGANGVVGRAVLNELGKDKSNVVTCTVRDGDGNNDFWYDWTSKSINNHCYHEVDLLSPQHCLTMINRLKPEVIYHLAATSTSYSTAHTMWCNTNMTLNLLEACRFTGVKPRFVQASSIVVENNPASVYSVSKQACEELVSVYTDLYESVDGICVRFPAVVGVGAKHGLLPDLIKKVLAEDDEIELFGDSPGSIKPFIYSARLAKYLTRLTGKDVVTLCPINSISVKEVAEIVMKELDIIKKIKWNPSKIWKGDQKMVYSDSRFVEYHFGDRFISQGAIQAATQDIMKEQYGK